MPSPSPTCSPGRGPDRELRWTGDVPHRLAGTFAAAGRDLVALLDGGTSAGSTAHDARGPAVIGVLAAVAAAYGAHLLYTALVLRWDGVGPGPARPRHDRTTRTRPADWLAQAGLGTVAVGEFAVVIAVVFVLGAALGLVLFGAPAPGVGGRAVRRLVPGGRRTDSAGRHGGRSPRTPGPG